MYSVKLSKGSLLLLHLVAAGHVWRDDKGLWAASTLHTRRNVHLRICKIVSQGMLTTNYHSHFPTLTELGKQYLRDHPVEDALQAKTIMREET